ncbi:NEAT domain-containing protein [Paenibacillus sp. HW567]|uniref:NEAT domain-containing protein n=1 Tax=Paenibacillus sp. HW567 TaxID=1034769 RepID=UPI000374512C|nr:NEAT domain-containing protein [Paenibacillus sp. HW567]
MKKVAHRYLLKVLALILLTGVILQPVGGASAEAESVRYKDGQYELPYQIFKDGTNETSVMENYVNKTAALEVKDGRNYVSITVNKNKEITGLKLTTADGKLSDGTVASVAADNNRRTTTFELGSLTDINDGWVKIDWDELNYHNQYDVDFKFNASSIPLAEKEPEQPQVPSDPVLADGQYSIDYAVLHATEEKDSSMKGYFSNPAVLTVDKGEKTISFSIVKDSSVVKNVYTANDGTNYVPVTNVSEDKTANTRIISFKVDRISGILPGKVHIVTEYGGKVYDMNHLIRFRFNLDSITAAPGATPTPTSTPAPVSTEPVSGGGGGTVPIPSVSPSPSPTANASLEDGHYSIDYSILKEGTDEVSMMDKYVVHPGTLSVVNGQKYLSFTLTQSKEITAFSVQQPVSVIASNTAANTRTVQFPISELGTKLKASVKIDWPEFNYFNSYNVDIRIGSSAGGKVANPAGSIAAAAPIPGASATPQASAAPAPANANANTAPSSVPEQSANAVKLSDIDGHWAKQAIQQALNSGLVKGFNDNTFRPNNPVSRAELAVLLSRALKLEGSVTNAGFSDKDGIPAWAAEGVAQVAANKLISGYEDGSFRADRKITRTELAVIVVRAQGLTVDPKSVPSFSDAADIAAWARPYIAAAEKAGLIGGKAGNQFAPGEYATRAEAVVLLLKLR